MDAPGEAGALDEVCGSGERVALQTAADAQQLARRQRGGEAAQLRVRRAAQLLRQRHHRRHGRRQGGARQPFQNAHLDGERNERGVQVEASMETVAPSVRLRGDCAPRTSPGKDVPARVERPFRRECKCTSSVRSRGRKRWKTKSDSISGVSQRPPPDFSVHGKTNIRSNSVKPNQT